MKPVHLGVLAAHVVSGFIGMYGGLVPLFVRKGGGSHRRWGRVFTWAMTVAAITAFPLAYWMGDAFQAAIGLLAGYGAIFGVRVLRRQRDGRDIGFAVISGIAFATLAVAAPVVWRESTAQVRTAVVFGLAGIVLVARDLLGLRVEPSPQRRVVDHMLAASLTLVVAWSSFLNTQALRLTGLALPIDVKMLLPFGVALPFLIYWVPRWHRRVGELGVRAWVGGRDGAELDRLRGLGLAEGVSFLVLLFIAVPLKRVAGQAAFVQVMGPVHGALFVLYTTAVVMAARQGRWGWRRVVGALGAAVLPFGPFLLDARMRRWGRSDYAEGV